MIRHMLCLLIVVVNSVVGAPGMDNIPQNDALLAREDKQKPSSSGTLDPIGGGNLVRIVDPDAELEILSSLESLAKINQDDIPQNTVLVARQDIEKPSSSGTLDSIGGGNLKIVDSDLETEIFRSLQSLLATQDNIPQNNALLARDDKQKHSSTGTLDPIGGGNLVRIVDPDAELEFLSSLESLAKINQDDIPQNTVLVARQDNQKPSSSGTLDSIGGGNILRIIDSHLEKDFFSALDSLIENQGRQNMMRLARDDKSDEKARAVDKIGGGILGLVDPYRVQVFRSLDRSHLADSLDQGGEVQRMFDSISASELLSSLDSADRMAVLSALKKTHSKYPNKRMLDSVSGWAFGESKRNFDEIDNVGFTGFAKRSPHRARQLALAKKNFDEIDRAGFETYNKRDFDEIDRAGFETFEKRDRKE